MNKYDPSPSLSCLRKEAENKSMQRYNKSRGDKSYMKLTKLLEIAREKERGVPIFNRQITGISN